MTAVRSTNTPERAPAMGPAARLLQRAVDGLLALLLLVMVLMVFGNVVLRYAFNSGITVSEELSRFCFVWLTFIGGVVAMRERTHLGLDTLVQRLPRHGRLACLALSQGLIVVCCAVLLWGTWRQHGINASNAAPVTGLSMIWIHGLGYVVALGIGTLALHTLWRIARGQVREEELVQVRDSEEPAASVPPSATTELHIAEPGSPAAGPLHAAADGPGASPTQRLGVPT